MATKFRMNFRRFYKKKFWTLFQFHNKNVKVENHYDLFYHDSKHFQMFLTILMFCFTFWVGGKGGGRFMFIRIMCFSDEIFHRSPLVDHLHVIENPTIPVISLRSIPFIKYNLSNLILLRSQLMKNNWSSVPN